MFEFKVIYSIRLAGWLMYQGFVLMDLRENERCPGRKVFYFKKSDSLEKEMEKYLKTKNK